MSAAFVRGGFPSDPRSCYDSFSSQPTDSDALPLRCLLRPEDPPNQMGLPCRPIEERFPPLSVHPLGGARCHYRRAVLRGTRR